MKSFGEIGKIVMFRMDVSTLALYAAVSGNQLTAAVGFTVLQLTSIIQQPISQFPMVVQQSATILVSVKRLKRFLAAEEMSEQVQLNEGDQGYVRFSRSSLSSVTEEGEGGFLFLYHSISFYCSFDFVDALMVVLIFF